MRLLMILAVPLLLTSMPAEAQRKPMGKPVASKSTKAEKTPEKLKPELDYSGILLRELAKSSKEAIRIEVTEGAMPEGSFLDEAPIPEVAKPVPTNKPDKRMQRPLSPEEIEEMKRIVGVEIKAETKRIQLAVNPKTS